MYRCAYCGNEYDARPDQCRGCGSRQFVRRVVEICLPEPLPTHTTGQKPKPKPLPFGRPEDREMYFAALDAVSMVARSAILTPLFLGLALLAVLLMTDLLFGLGV